ncbi:MAG TPA: phosphoribosyltransferase, partial [Marmoricola sp.]
AVIVDDGIATGSTARAACQVARHLGAKKVVVAVPVAPADVSADLLAADELVCCAMPPAFRAVGEYYRDFSSTTDDEVAALLEHDAAVRAGPGQVRRPSIDADVEIELGQRIVLPGRLTVPADSGGLVVFAHGSGSTRSSPRNRRVAAELQSAGLGTLLLDLLTPDEADDRGNVFDIALLGSRVSGVARWVLERPGLASVRLGLFGASTGAAAALWAAADPGSRVAAVVSRGGRPDLAADRLPWVVAPTLLIVGGDDTEVLDLNRQAQSRLRCPNRLVVVPGATHLFEEPGTLDQVARLARAWFGVHLLGVEGPPARSETP